MIKKLLVLTLILLNIFLPNKNVYAQETYGNLKINILENTSVKKQTPKLDIETSKTEKLKCEDVVFLHNYWLAIEIITPILVIVFGSLDFIVSIMSGNEDKINNSRKKFPKRLVAAFCIFLVFSVVSIITGISKNDNVRENDIIKCIINGE